MPQFAPTLNLRALALQAFGNSPLSRYHAQIDRAVELPISLPILPPLPPHQDGIGLLDLPLFATATFTSHEGDSAAAPSATTPGLALRAPQQPLTFTLTDPLVEISRETIIVSTTIQGRTGQVKEYIGNGDFTITFKGVMASPMHDGHVARNYPVDQVQDLGRLCTGGKSLEVACYLLQPLNITNVVVKKLKLTPMAGFTNLQAYELECISDDPIELSLALPV